MIRNIIKVLPNIREKANEMLIKTIKHIITLKIIIALSACVYGNEKKSDQANNVFTIHPFSMLDKSIADSFTGFNLLLHGAAAGSTFLFTSTGADWAAHKYFKNNDRYEKFFSPAAWTGYIFPTVVSGGYYLIGLCSENNRALIAGSAMIQSLFISITYNTLLKAFTGRPNPGSSDHDNSSDFQWGFMRGGVHYGWPSGHMCTTTAMFVSLSYIYSDSWFIKTGGMVYSTYMFFGVIAHEGGTMHWLSDAVAGTLFGFAIGTAVGKNFMKVLMKKNDDGSEVQFLPVLSSYGNGISVSFIFSP